MASQLPTTSPHQQRVMLWTMPRSTSTVFLKCFSYLPNMQIFHEPYVCAFHFGPERHPPPADSFLAADNQGEFQQQLGEIEVDFPMAFSFQQCTYKFLKDELEADFPGKDLVFGKDMAYSLTGKFDMLPKGYRHTFLIRNPYRIFPSYKKLLGKLIETITGQKEFRICDLQPPILAKNYCFQEQYELMMYLKEQGVEPKPIVIDADDLLTNPASILNQYCTLLGIPFKESMLEWPSGTEILKSWKGARELLLGNFHESAGGYYDVAMKSSRFKPSGAMPRREDLSDDVLKCVDHSMPYYEKMHELRLKP